MSADHLSKRFKVTSKSSGVNQGYAARDGTKALASEATSSAGNGAVSDRVFSGPAAPGTDDHEGSNSLDVSRGLTEQTTRRVRITSKSSGVNQGYAVPDRTAVLAIVASVGGGSGVTLDPEGHDRALEHRAQGRDE